MFDDAVRTNSSIDRARRYSQCKHLKRSYVKYISGNAYIIYSFWVNPSIKNLYKGVFVLTTEQKMKIINFWNDSDLSDDILRNAVIQSSIDNPMPLNDYRNTVYDKQIKGM